MSVSVGVFACVFVCVISTVIVRVRLHDLFRAPVLVHVWVVHVFVW